MKCNYCNENEGIYTLKSKKLCCMPSFNSCPEIKRKNKEGIKNSKKERKIDYKNRYANLSEETKARMNWNKGKIHVKDEEIFMIDSKHKNEQIKKIFLTKTEYKCDECGISDYNNEPLVLELEHINGNNKDNRIENLRLLCPNCHSQTNTYGRRKKNPS